MLLISPAHHDSNAEATTIPTKITPVSTKKATASTTRTQSPTTRPSAETPSASQALSAKLSHTQINVQPLRNLSKLDGPLAPPMSKSLAVSAVTQIQHPKLRFAATHNRLLSCVPTSLRSPLDPLLSTIATYKHITGSKPLWPLMLPVSLPPQRQSHRPTHTSQLCTMALITSRPFLRYTLFTPALHTHFQHR